MKPENPLLPPQSDPSPLALDQSVSHLPVLLDLVSLVCLRLVQPLIGIPTDTLSQLAPPSSPLLSVYAAGL